METICLGCGQTGELAWDGLCGLCAREGSMECGLWAAEVLIEGLPATTADEVRRVLRALAWEDCEFGLARPEAGVWLLPLPSLLLALLLSHGCITQASGSSSVLV